MAKDAITWLVIGGMLLVTGVFAWAYSSIICPDCKLKLLWYSITKVGLGTWFNWLVNLENCPQCEKLNGLPKPDNKRGRGKAKGLR